MASGESGGSDAGQRRDGVLRRFIGALSSIWDSIGEQADLIAGVLLVCGVALVGAAIALDLHSVPFNGHLKHGEIKTLINGVTAPLAIVKEVGFLWAPNWGMTGLIFLPLAILNLLRAKSSIEPLLRNLVSKNMLVRREDLSPIELSTVLESWREEASRWAGLVFPIFLLVAFGTLFGDFIPVVAQWIFADPQQLGELASKTPLQHSSYEFDWSIASTFRDSHIGSWTNFWFSLAAYIVIPMTGAPLLFSGFVWFLSLASLLSKLDAQDIIMIPNIHSKDKRLGFEVFERMFAYLVNASLLTATITLCMHLQNVYLRSPRYDNIMAMTFGDGFNKASEVARTLNFGILKNYLTNIADVLEVAPGSLSPQSYIAFIAIIVMSAVVLLSIWVYLRSAALDGMATLREMRDLSDADKERLDAMNIWPVGWLSLNLYICVFAIIGASLWFVNLPSLVVIFFLGKAVSAVFSGALGAFSTRRKAGS